MMTNNFIKNRAIPSRSSCGFQDSDNKVEGFIVGGKETQIDEFPWMASLGYTDSRGNRKWACGGTLISPRYVLTAAHCVVGEVERRVGRLSVIKLGEHDTKTEVDCIKSKCNDAPVTVNVEQVITHPGYDQSVNSPNDIALVRLDRSVHYTKYIRPICLPELNEATSAGVNITTAGWGRTEYGVPSTVLLKVDIPVVNKVVCSRQYLAQGVNLVDSQICAGGEGGKDSCSGDSGGPLMRRSDSNILQWFQEGIVSFGSLRCGIKGLPAVYTKVSSFVQWIHSTIRD
ncbi:unnamed protein product [Phyllotreta striolata]|nr:unnamed protein product [Phyllotreta striolata]